jgi:hypothetical protein
MNPDTTLDPRSSSTAVEPTPWETARDRLRDALEVLDR